MKVYNTPFNTGTILNTTFFSEPFQLNQGFGYSIQAVITGIPTGTFSLQSSTDPNTGAANLTFSHPTNFNLIAGSSVNVTDSGIITWNVTDVMYNYVRVSYTDGSGGASTATMSGTINQKGI